MTKLITVIALFSTLASSKLLDKIAGVVNDNVITLSEVQRVKSTTSARKEISPLIYKESSYTQKDVLKLMERSLIIRDHLSEIGYVVSDDRVESRIKETEKRLGISTAELNNFLSSKSITFSEYFSLIREAMEFNIFTSNVIGPLVNITDQEVKNYYYKLNQKNKTLSFKFNISDYSYSSNSLSKSQKSQVSGYLEEYIKTGTIPAAYKNFEVNNIDGMKGNDLPKDLGELLSDTDEGSFTKPYTKNNITHIFYIRKKDLTESDEFSKLKPRIKNALFIQRSEKIVKSWINNKSLNYYILENI